MSNTFKNFLKKVGSGPHTGKNLTRQEAAEATRLMLLQEATPAQIGAFMIAHRIRRPTGEELAGMLDAYNQLGPQLQTQDLGFQNPVTVLGNPYDGRARNIPVTVITALILATVEIPVILHGGACMPTKYGIPFSEIWQALGINFCNFSLTQVQSCLQRTYLGFVYLPQHFPLAHDLVPYREQIGKRPPFATLELFWSPYGGNIHLVSGYVHPPTENLFKEVFKLHKIPCYTTIKGLEGSCDLPRSRTGIVGLGTEIPDSSFQRFYLHPREYDLGGEDVPLESSSQLQEELHKVLQGKSTELMKAAILNGGFYLWRCGFCPDLATGLTQAEDLLTHGKVAEKLQELQAIIID